MADYDSWKLQSPPRYDPGCTNYEDGVECDCDTCHDKAVDALHNNPPQDEGDGPQFTKYGPDDD